MTAYHDFIHPTSLSNSSRGYDFYKEEEEATVLDDGILIGSLGSPDNFGGDFADPPELNSATSSNPFYKLNSFALTNGGAATETWTSGSCTPTPHFENFALEQYDGGAASVICLGGAPLNPSRGPATAFGANGATMMRHNSMTFPSASSTTTTVSFPSSPPLEGGQEWMSAAANEQTQPRSMSMSMVTRRGPGSPLRPQSPLLRRGDGIRKKNARFEIPAERNLHNIDHFIAQSSDDREIKELKQQKRLLRNRQAALDSRQRKKQHTERLEEEKKSYTTVISELEERVAELEVREAEYLRAQENWKVTQQNYEHFVQTLHLEKEELVRRHTLETGDLRKKNAFLTDQMQKIESTAMSAVPSSSGFSTNEFSDIESITMEGNSWDQYSFINDFSIENEPKPMAIPQIPVPQRPQMALVTARKADKVANSDLERPAASGILLVLLLCGAFVASRSATTSTANIPRMPDNVIAASATVLDNIFRDAGVQQRAGIVPMPSAVSWSASETAKAKGYSAKASSRSSASDLIGLSSLSLDRLVGPTEQEEQDQLFSLTADQYNSLTSHDTLHMLSATESTSIPPAAKASVRTPTSSMADVYTRSLMWDRVPAEVVREFARFVADAEALDRAGDGEHVVG